MNNTTLVAICGKSASGKDTLKKQLHYYLSVQNISNNVVLQETTRAPRVNERHEVDYAFLPRYVFTTNILKQRYLEYNIFNNNFYGTPWESIGANTINIGIFTPKSIEELVKIKNQLNIIFVYVKEHNITRLQRAYKRNKEIFEPIRRLIYDTVDFRNLEKDIPKYFEHYIIIEPNMRIDEQVKIVYNKLYKMGSFV